MSDIDNPVIQSLNFAQPLFTAAITPESSQNYTELIQVALSSDYPTYKYSINFSLVNASEGCDNKLFAIQPTTGIIYLTGPITTTNNITNSSLFCRLNVAVSNSRHSINIQANVSIYNVPASSKISLYQKKPLLLENKWSQAYLLSNGLRNTFGLLVNVEPVEENGNLTQFLVSLVCPKTHQVLTLDEVHQVFKYAMEDLQIIFRKYQISMRNQPKSALWKFIFGSSSNENDDDEYEEDEIFLFHDVDALYLYYAVGIGYIFMFEIILIVLMLIVKRIVCCLSSSLSKTSEDCNQNEENRCNQLVLLEKTNKLPPAIQELLYVKLEKSSEEEETCPNESEC